MTPEYTLLDPGGNRTILVTQSVRSEKRASVAAELMKLEPTAEQVGFIGPGSGETELSLSMAGGEFCGNASMCAAVYLAESRGLREFSGALRVSGAPSPVVVKVCSTPDTNGIWNGSVEMPSAQRIETVTFPDKSAAPVVFFPGIAHCVFSGEPERKAAEEKIKSYCAFLGADALGFMFVSGERLKPLVYVPGADTLFWESSCGSGSCAVAALTAKRTGRPVSLTLFQPGGKLDVSADTNGKVILRGTVAIIKRGN